MIKFLPFFNQFQVHVSLLYRFDAFRGYINGKSAWSRLNRDFINKPPLRNYQAKVKKTFKYVLSTEHESNTSGIWVIRHKEKNLTLRSVKSSNYQISDKKVALVFTKLQKTVNRVLLANKTTTNTQNKTKSNAKNSIARI